MPLIGQKTRLMSAQCSRAEKAVRARESVQACWEFAGVSQADQSHIPRSGNGQAK